MHFDTPIEALRYHVTGAIERGKGEAIIEEPTEAARKERRAQAHCSDPSTKGDGWFDGYEREG